MHKSPKVTVCVVTYNQKPYIASCLSSLVEQVTNFKYEIVVSDDASRDGTQHEIAKFKERYPEIIRVAYQKRNLGPTRNYVFAYRIARGDYIIHMDGDDYALPGKLQLLSDALDARPDVNVAWHRMLVLSPDGNLNPDKIKCWLQPPNGFTQADLLAVGTIGAHSAKICRRTQRILVGRPKEEIMDYFATVEHLAGGRAIWINKVAGVYREGVGIGTTARLQYARLLVRHLMFFSEKYEVLSDAINAHALWLIIKDITAFRSTGAFTLWRRTLRWRGLVAFVKYSSFYILSRI